MGDRSGRLEPAFGEVVGRDSTDGAGGGAQDDELGVDEVPLLADAAHEAAVGDAGGDEEV